jgi:conjugative transfer signal peptidase TraF
MRERARLLGIGAAAAVCVALTATTIVAPLPRLVWNASASAPIGLYRVTPGARVRVGDMVIARLPVAMRLLAARRRYLPIGVPLVKRVFAITGARVCASGSFVSVNGHQIVRRRAADRVGRSLPAWSGCRTLGAGEIFLAMTRVNDSFDGRYFGPTAANDVIGKATPLWVR